MADRMIAQRAGVGATAGIRQLRDLRFRALVVDQPILILVRRGTKLVARRDEHWSVDAVGAVLIAAPDAYDVTNRPDADGLYEGDWLAWDAGVLAHYAEAAPRLRRPRQDVVALPAPDAAFRAAFEAACASIADPASVPDAVARHRVGELLVWLTELGADFRPREVVSAAAGVRRLVAAAPARDWSGPGVAEALAMSEATLRRRLRAEGTSFSDVLADVRMSHALQLLQATDASVTAIALDVGYESASRFAIRFRQRFGCAPSDIRGHMRQAAE